MRTVLTFVLKILVDSERPDDLRGSLRNISSEAEPGNFRSETELLAHLLKCVAEAQNDSLTEKEDPFQ